MTKSYKEQYNEWRQWPQVRFDIDLFDEVHDWVMNRFGVQYPGKEEVVLVSKNPDHFRIAIKDPKILNVTLLKFTCEMCLCEYDQMKAHEAERASLDAEIKRLITEIQQKISVVGSPYENYIKEAVKEDGLFSYDNGVWTNVKE